MISRLAVALALLPGLVLAQLTPREKKGVDDALLVGNYTRTDLQYERKPFNDKYRLPLENLSLDKPLEAADSLMVFHQRGKSTKLSDLIAAARTLGLNDPEKFQVFTSHKEADPNLSKLPAPLRSPVNRIVHAVTDCNEMVKGALSKLSSEEARYLIETLPLYANEEPSIKFGYTTRSSYDPAKILQLIDKIDLPSLRLAAHLLAISVEQVRPELEAAARKTTAPLSMKIRLNGLVVDIGGIENNVHEAKDAVISIDLGGDDIYRGRHAAGIGYSSVLIDLGGNDTFDLPDLNLGCGILGVGLAFDYGGHDLFRTKSLSLGCGLAGVGALYREGGKDTYESISLSQGFGEFGIGILEDTAGDDRYDLSYNGQGAGRTGGIGWLDDLKGDDVYRAGGLILNSPLFENVHYSNAQGYGSGYREDTGGTSGGIGMLTDFEGDDSYLGETYCQAASYWFSIGTLFDESGNDTYSAYHYAQASAMHMTSAYLFDLAGDDAYVVKFGAGQSIGHDYGVSFLLDRAGMDLYASHDSRPATGNANGLAIFIDAAGDDRYFGAPAAGNPARGSGSLAVFCDLGGSDIYSRGLNDDQATAGESWAVAVDEPSALTSAPAAPTDGSGEIQKPVPGSIPAPSDEALALLYRKATQWGVGTALKEVAESNAHLIGIGLPAVKWMIDKRLATASRLEVRSFVAVINGVGPEARALIAPKVASDNLDEARVALGIVMDGNMKQAAPYIPIALSKPQLARSAARAAGVLGSRESVATLLPLTVSDDNILALNATLALGALADPQSLTTGEALLQSDQLPIRKAAIDLVAKFPVEGGEFARRQLSGGSDRQIRDAIEILGKIGGPENIKAIGTMLDHPSASVRIGALLALDHRVPSELRPTVSKLQNDADPLVRSVAARIDLGR